jgi:rubredoxin
MIDVARDACYKCVTRYRPIRQIIRENSVNDEPLKRFMCDGCGFLYDEALGLPEHGIAPGTRWADIPDTWVCPDCGTPKHRFEMVEMPYAPGQPAAHLAAR